MVQSDPTFFEIGCLPSDEQRTPLATGRGFASRVSPCPACGGRWSRYVGEGRYEIKYGRSWTDAIPIAGYYPPFIVSERVARGMEKISATGFTLLPVRIEKVHSEYLRVLAEPKYFYPDVYGFMQIDDEASGFRNMTRCPGCWTNISGTTTEARRYMPRVDGWDGSDVFSTIRAPIWGQLFCTRRVLDVARQEAWTNLRFEPMDIVREHASGWSGIDYLGKAWPPDQWYPTPPSAGKSLAEWLVLMRDPDRARSRPARIAIQDIGPPAIPALTAMLNDPSSFLREEAARILFLTNSREPLPESTKARVRALLPPETARYLK